MAWPLCEAAEKVASGSRARSVAITSPSVRQVPEATELDERDWEMIENLFSRLLAHKVWVDADPGLGDLKYDNAQRAKEILRGAGLTPGWILGAES